MHHEGRAENRSRKRKRRKRKCAWHPQFLPSCHVRKSQTIPHRVKSRFLNENFPVSLHFHPWDNSMDRRCGVKKSYDRHMADRYEYEEAA